MIWTRSLFVLLVVACVSACGRSAGEQVASRLRDAYSNQIVRVEVIPATLLDPDRVEVYLRSGTTDAEANELVCRVVVPAAGGVMRVDVWNESGTAALGVDAECD